MADMIHHVVKLLTKCQHGERLAIYQDYVALKIEIHYFMVECLPDQAELI